MQTATPVFSEDGARQETLTAHTQAVEQAIQTMHTHLQEPLTLEDLAAVACLSPYHFNRIFRRLIGIPPGEFLSALRFQMARRLLLTTTLNVIDICFEVGYSSVGSFTSRFTQLVGFSPRILRQRTYEFGQLAETPLIQTPISNVLIGKVSTPAPFIGEIYIGLFSTPIPQGVPVSCTKVTAPGLYMLNKMPADGIYYLLSAAFPGTTGLQSYGQREENILLGKGTDPIVVHHGHITGSLDIALRTPRLTDPPLVMALPAHRKRL